MNTEFATTIQSLAFTATSALLPPAVFGDEVEAVNALARLIAKIEVTALHEPIEPFYKNISACADGACEAITDNDLTEAFARASAIVVFLRVVTRNGFRPEFLDLLTHFATESIEDGSAPAIAHIQ